MGRWFLLDHGERKRYCALEKEGKENCGSQTRQVEVLILEKKGALHRFQHNGRVIQ